MLRNGWKLLLAGVVMAGLCIVSDASAGFPYQIPKAVEPGPKEPGDPPPVNPPPPPPPVDPPPVVPPPEHCDSPEPATLTLAALGIAGAAGYRRFRKSR